MEYSIVMCNFIGRQRRKYCAFRWWFNVSLMYCSAKEQTKNSSEQRNMNAKIHNFNVTQIW